MRLTSIKDCKNCSNALVYGSVDNATVKCNSDDYINIKLFREQGRHCAGQCKGYVETKFNRAGSLEQDKALQFILAGNSEFILHSTKTNEDFMYNIVKEESASDKEKFIYFVNIINGRDTTYAGILIENEETKEFEFKQGKNGNVESCNLSIKSLVFVINKLNKGDKVGNLEFYHLGKCGCCGAKLIDTQYEYCKLHRVIGDER